MAAFLSAPHMRYQPDLRKAAATAFDAFPILSNIYQLNPARLVTADLSQEGEAQHIRLDDRYPEAGGSTQCIDATRTCPNGVERQLQIWLELRGGGRALCRTGAKGVPTSLRLAARPPLGARRVPLLRTIEPNRGGRGSRCDAVAQTIPMQGSKDVVWRAEDASPKRDFGIAPETLMDPRA
jgi:hypothetical protein